MTEWYKVNGQILNTDKMNIRKFSPSNRQNNNFQFTRHTKLLVAANNTKFWGLELDKHVNWKNHIKKILPKLVGACYLIQRLYTSCNINTLRMIYFFIFSFNYGIWHNVLESIW